jgi:hypothetical protein
MDISHMNPFVNKVEADWYLVNRPLNDGVGRASEGPSDGACSSAKPLVDHVRGIEE